MLNKILTMIASSVTKETLSSIGNAILASQVRSNFRRAIRDCVEDEVAMALRDYEIEEKEIKRYIKISERHFKREIRARFDALLMKE